MSGVGLHGVDPGRLDDPMVIAVAGPFDAPAAVGPLSKDRLEDMQLWSFLFAVAMTSATPHPVASHRPQSDPPDRVLICGNTKWAVELTQITVSDVRSDFATARTFGRELEAFLHDHAADYPHLVGRRVTLAMLPEWAADPPSDSGQGMALLKEALAVDQGVVGEGLDLSAGPPAKLPVSGIYGQFGPFNVLVHQDGAPDAIAVTASAQGQIHRSEAIASLNERIQAKDNAANDTLIITCGRPDQRGFSCPLDAFIYRLIADAAADGDVLAAAPEHLNGVALHLWPTNEWIEVYRTVDTPMPWTEG